MANSDPFAALRQQSCVIDGKAGPCSVKHLRLQSVPEYLPDGAGNAASAQQTQFSIGAEHPAYASARVGSVVTFGGVDYTVSDATATTQPGGAKAKRLLCYLRPQDAPAVGTDGGQSERKQFWPADAPEG